MNYKIRFSSLAKLILKAVFHIIKRSFLKVAKILVKDYDKLYQKQQNPFFQRITKMSEFTS
jgi:hypothetical protein